VARAAPKRDGCRACRGITRDGQGQCTSGTAHRSTIAAWPSIAEVTLHWHWAFTQCCGASQSKSQLPQCLSFVRMSTQPSDGQHTRLKPASMSQKSPARPGHTSVPPEHAPRTQVSPASQAWKQPPQCVGSVAMSKQNSGNGAPPMGTGQHAPNTPASVAQKPPPGPHSLETQAPPAHVSPDGQSESDAHAPPPVGDGRHVPPTHCPDAQVWPQYMQFPGSWYMSAQRPLQHWP